MKLTNQQIYTYAQSLSAFNIEQKMPVKIGFFLRKNIQTIIEAGTEIEQAKMKLAAEYGTINAAGTGYDISPENISKVNQELMDLFSLEQELNIHVFTLENFDGIELTYNELSSIMFMMEEE